MYEYWKRGKSKVQAPQVEIIVNNTVYFITTNVYQFSFITNNLHQPWKTTGLIYWLITKYVISRNIKSTDSWSDSHLSPLYSAEFHCDTPDLDMHMDASEYKPPAPNNTLLRWAGAPQDTTMIAGTPRPDEDENLIENVPERDLFLPVKMQSHDLWGVFCTLGARFFEFTWCEQVHRVQTI